MENNQLVSIANRFGSPVFVYDAHRIISQYDRLTKAFAKVDQLRINYAVKALSNVSILKLMKELGYGAEYKYSHDYANNFAEQEFLPDEIKNTKIYEPGNNARENTIRDFLKKLWKGKYGY